MITFTERLLQLSRCKTQRIGEGSVTFRASLNYNNTYYIIAFNGGTRLPFVMEADKLGLFIMYFVN